MNNSGDRHNKTFFYLGVIAGTSLGTILYLHYQNNLLKKKLSQYRHLVQAENENGQQRETGNYDETNVPRKEIKIGPENHNGGSGIVPKKITVGTGNYDEEDFKYYTMREIGIIRSPYPHRAGTPRQGLLASHSRSHLELHSHVVPKECLDGLEEYSHVWIFFQFHLNPIGKQGALAPCKKINETINSTKSSRNRKKNKDGNATAWFKSSKVKPPRANGKKVGVLATRSPHRPNNIGLSLAKLESIATETYHDYDSDQNTTTAKTRKKTRPKKRTIVKLLGLDLVDGTPIYDIKPYLPWDQVAPCHKIISTRIQNDAVNTEENINDGRMLRVPSWVSADDELASVTWTKESYNFVLDSRNTGDLSPLYKPIKKKELQLSQSTDEDDEVHKAIAEVIAQDPRAQHEGRGRIMVNDNMHSYDITFCTLRISFIITPQRKQLEIVSGESSSTNSKNAATIIQVVQDPGDPNAQPGSYQHSLAMRRIVEQQQSLCSDKKRIRWKYPIQEGCTEGLYDLQQGGTCEPPMSHIS